MKYAFLIALLGLTVVSCGDDTETKEEKKEEVVLKTEEDKWSYRLGHDAGAPLMSAQNPNIRKIQKRNDCRI